MLKIGITGGIGSGKTTVCKIFELLGVHVYYADDRARWITNHDALVIASIKEHFGDSAYDQDGKLKRAWMAKRVFSNPDELKILNSIVHPAVFRDSEEWMKEHAQDPYVLKEAALLIESGSYQSLDQLIVVVSPEALRIQRVMERDEADEMQVRSRMANQTSDVEKIALADHVIYNDTDHLLIPQIMQLHQQFTSTSQLMNQ